MVASRVALFALLVAGMSSAAKASAQERVPAFAVDDKEIRHNWASGDPIPPFYHVEKRPLLAPVIAGGVMFASGWIMGAAMGASSLDKGGAYAFIPIAGPFVAAARYRDPPCSFLCIDIGPGLYRAFQALAGVQQAIGVAMVIGGAVARKEKLVFGDVVPVPIVGQDRAGLGFVGRF